MDVLTLEGFKRYCNENKFSRIIYNTDNNHTHPPSNLKLSLSFEIIIVVDTPEQRCVTLKSTKGSLTFYNVKGIRLNKSRSFINAECKSCGWIEADIICEPFDVQSRDGKPKVYTLVLDY